MPWGVWRRPGAMGCVEETWCHGVCGGDLVPWGVWRRPGAMGCVKETWCHAWGVWKFVLIASDGLWNVMTPNEVVSFIWKYEHDMACHQESKDVVRALINQALRRWKTKGLLADNVAVLIAFLSEQTPPSAHGLHRNAEGTPHGTRSPPHTPWHQVSSTPPLHQSPPQCTLPVAIFPLQ